MSISDKVSTLFSLPFTFFIAWSILQTLPGTWRLYTAEPSNFLYVSGVVLPVIAVSAVSLSLYSNYVTFFKKAP